MRINDKMTIKNDLEASTADGYACGKVLDQCVGLKKEWPILRWSISQKRNRENHVWNLQRRHNQSIGLGTMQTPTKSTSWQQRSWNRQNSSLHEGSFFAPRETLHKSFDSSWSRLQCECLLCFTVAKTLRPVEIKMILGNRGAWSQS